MRRFEREEDLIHPQVFNAATWGARMLLAIAICLLAVGVSLADGKKHKLSNDLEAFKDGSNGPTVDVIIQINQVPTDVHHQKVQNKGGVLRSEEHTSELQSLTNLVCHCLLLSFPTDALPISDVAGDCNLPACGRRLPC